MAQRKFSRDNSEINEPEKGSFQVGFTTGKGNNISIRKDSMDIIKEKIFKDEDSTNKGSSFKAGFQTAKGGITSINNDAFNLMKNKLFTDNTEPQVKFQNYLYSQIYMII